MRAVDKWIGATDDTTVPRRIQARVFLRADGKCQGCGRKVGSGIKDWQVDHVVALINSGRNDEANLQILCTWCHVRKTAKDITEKSKMARKRARHIGLVKSRHPMPGGRASTWKRKINGEIVRR